MFFSRGRQAPYTTPYSTDDDANLQIIFNPGTSANSGYFSAADIVVTYEDSYSSFSTSDLAISSSTPAAKQAVILYDAPTSTASVASLINQLKSLGIGAVFVTDDGLDNPYDTVPTVWDDEVADVAAAAAA